MAAVAPLAQPGRDRRSSARDLQDARVQPVNAADSGLEGAFLAFIMAGAFQILFGLCRLGSLIRYIPHPVVSGFMGGIAGAVVQ
ncbi:SulP family inorganic anion transporter [Streptomyces sp. NPDC051243]|uniref:SulP family inorganic anion transporter n=1 Tax=Streptomyces sp. NPDC051243 TaxID=3365646 RepID=UPI003795F8EE